jgi:hypothetical protein
MVSALALSASVVQDVPQPPVQLAWRKQVSPALPV